MKKLVALGLLLFPSLVAAQDRSWNGAQWVWDEPDANTVAQNNEPRYLRRFFDLSAKVDKAELWITVDNHYVAYVNGQKVGEDAEWSSVEKYDVAKHLVVGKNVLAIKATNQGGVAGAIARLHVRTVDKKDIHVVTDEKTKITQKAAKDWLALDFDDSAWFAAVVLGDPSIGPWNIGGSAVAETPGKGPKAYGSSAVDATVKTRLSAQDQIKHFIVPKDFEIELVVADPVVINPITMVLDDKGRIIVSESHTYRYGPPGSPIKPFANPVVRLDPDGKGGFTRTLIADGFDDPVMGIAVKGDKLWLTANNFLYTYDIDEASRGRKPPEKGIATNKKAILTDKNKAWNPFGMFVLEWGPDGKLYMSVGNHAINIEGPDGKISGRGSSGIILRMNPDGTKMERLVHGLRVPYSFEYDPFGQLWLLSNGEGNPDRFVRVIDGVDYHCYSRGNVDNNWLAGNHPLAPPCEEVHGGAHTQLMRYYAAAYPAEYQGNLFACNWGRHGFAGPNRGIFRFVLDERDNVVKKETLVACTDPHFRPSHIHLDVDGSLLIADWYGRDDESDMTGRIWRLKYVGKDRPVVKHKLDAAEWKNDDYAIHALGSPDHLIRAKAVEELITRAKIVEQLGEHARTAKEPLGAAFALWALHRMNSPDSKKEVREMLWTRTNPDWRIRRLVAKINNQYGKPVKLVLEKGIREEDPAVSLERALGHSDAEAVRFVVMQMAFRCGAAKDVHLRYQAAWHLAKHADAEAITQLLTSDDADVRLAGLIAIDVACYENFSSKKGALEALVQALENPGKLDHQLLLMVAQLDGDASIVPALEKLIARDDLPTATIAKAVLVLKAKSGGSLASSKLSAAAGKRLVEAVEKGTLKIATPADQLVLFDFLESEGPTAFSLKQIGGQLRSGQPALREAAHRLARKFGVKSAPLAEALWSSVFTPKGKMDEVVESIATLARIEAEPRAEAWGKLLTHADPVVRTEALRWWRGFKARPDMIALLASHAPDLIKADADAKEDLAAVWRHLEASPTSLKGLDLPGAETDKAALTTHALAAIAALPPPERAKRALLGAQVFDRAGCMRCHTTATQTTPLAPSLKGIAAQKTEYLIESVLFPSKIIKTGFEAELVTTLDGKALQGLVKEEGKYLRVLSLEREDRVLKSDVESRAVLRVSIMPEGQEAQLSRREFVDLIAYLATLK
jgi:putative membrane-bound dehydrogenase-like protein